MVDLDLRLACRAWSAALSKDFTEPLIVLPYTLGVYLAVNALRDARLLMDAPNCAFFRACFIQGNHDLQSDLLDCTGTHRILNTDADVERNIMFDRSATIRTLLANLVRDPNAGGVFVAAIPMAYLTGVQYDKIALEIAADLGQSSHKPILVLPNRSLQAGWLDGYADALELLAENLDLAPDDPSAHHVGLVGYLFDRNEEDHRSSIRELERLLGGIGLEVTSVWLDGGTIDELRRIRDVGLIVSLPYGRAAARTIARKTGATLVETELPLGLEATAEWLKRIARATGRLDAAISLVEAELARVIPRVERVIPTAFPGRRFLLIVEENVQHGLQQLIEEAGAEVFTMSIAHPRGDLSIDSARIDACLDSVLAGGPIDLAISTGFCLPMLMNRKIPFLEFGFISHTEHCLHSRPFLGYEGYLSLIERLYNRMQLFSFLEGQGDHCLSESW